MQQVPGSGALSNETNNPQLLPELAADGGGYVPLTELIGNTNPHHSSAQGNQGPVNELGGNNLDVNHAESNSDVSISQDATRTPDFVTRTAPATEFWLSNSEGPGIADNERRPAGETASPHNADVRSDVLHAPNPMLLPSADEALAEFNKAVHHTSGNQETDSNDPLEATRNQWKVYSPDRGEGSVLFVSELQDAKEILYANSDIIATETTLENGFSSIAFWDSHTLKNVLSVWVDPGSTCDRDTMLYNMMYDAKRHIFALDAIVYQANYHETRFAINLASANYESICVPGGSSEDFDFFTSKPTMPSYRAFKDPEFSHILQIVDDGNIPDEYSENKFPLKVIDSLRQMQSSKEAFNFHDIDYATLEYRSISTGGKGPIRLLTLNQLQKLPGLPHSRKLTFEASCGSFYPRYNEQQLYFISDQSDEDSHQQTFSSESVGIYKHAPVVFCYDAVKDIMFPYRRATSWFDSKRVFIGSSDMGMYTISPHYEHGSLSNFNVFAGVYDKNKGRMVPVIDCRGAGSVPKEMSGYELPLRDDPIYFDECDVLCPCALSVWNKVPGQPEKAYWIAANEGACAVYEIDMRTRRGRQLERWEIASTPVWLENQKRLLLPFQNGVWKVYTLDDTKPAVEFSCRMYTRNRGEYAFVLENGHYTGSPGCERFLRANKGSNRLVSMETLARWRNRPAEVLKALGGKEEDIAVLQETTARWLRKQGIDSPEALGDEPDADCFSKAELVSAPLLCKEDTVEVVVKITRGAKPIQELEVLADGIRIPQKQLGLGAEIEQTVAVKVPLAVKENWIEIWPIDESGMPGDKVRFRVIREGVRQSDLYVVSLGVSKYDQPDLDLQYAAQDAADLAHALEQYGGNCQKHVLLLQDKDVTHGGTPQAIRDFVSKAKPDDRVVFFCAGHGLLDDRLDYYFAPSDIDPEDVSHTGISMDALMDAVAASPARERLMLLDTCHAGALGEADEDRLAMLGALPPGVRAIQHRGMKVKHVAHALNANQKKRYIEEIFAMGDSRRGIHVIAGSAGAEYAQESSSWHNGVFTMSVIEALSGRRPCDLNGDGKISVQELKKNVEARVPELTGGAQRPKASAFENPDSFVIGVGEQTQAKTQQGEENPDTEYCKESIGKGYAQGALPVARDLEPTTAQRELQQHIDRLSAMPAAKGARNTYRKQLILLLKAIQNGGGINMTLANDRNGNTALHHACALDDVDIVKWLLEQGADPDSSNKQNEEPAQCAKRNHCDGVLQLYRERGLYIPEK